MLLDRAVLVNLFSRSNSQKQARKSGGHVVGEFNRTDPTAFTANNGGGKKHPWVLQSNHDTLTKNKQNRNK